MSVPSASSVASGILEPVVCCLERITSAAIKLKYLFIAFICRDQDAARGMRLAEASPDSSFSQQYSNSTPFNVHTQGRI